MPGSFISDLDCELGNLEQVTSSLRVSVSSSEKMQVVKLCPESY